MLLSLQKKITTNKQNKQTNNQTKQQQQNTKTATTYISPYLHHRWRCYQAIALNDQQAGPTSLALLSL